MSKPRSDSVLKNLPEDRQFQIAEWCAKPNDVDEETGRKIPRTGGLAFAQDQLAADGLKTSLDTLSRFFSWYQLEQDLEISFEREKQVLERTGDVKLAREAGESLLLRLGIAKQDADLITAATRTIDSRRGLDLAEETGRTKARQKDRQIAQKDADLALSDRRVKLLEAKLAQVTEAVSDPTALPTDQVARLKEIFGIS